MNGTFTGKQFDLKIITFCFKAKKRNCIFYKGTPRYSKLGTKSGISILNQKLGLSIYFCPALRIWVFPYVFCEHESQLGPFVLLNIPLYSTKEYQL